MDIQLALHHLRHFFAPHQCGICQRPLMDTENLICSSCSTCIQSSHHQDYTQSTIARLFWGTAPIIRGGILFHYQSEAPVSNILVNIKYRKHADTSLNMGRVMGCYFQTQQFFEGIDCIVPVPLSKERYQYRGYNQSEEIAKGISEVTQIDVDATSIIRIQDNRTQTHLTSAERMKNVEGIFQVKHPEQLDGKHILIVDDIITTGATINSLIRTISDVAPKSVFSVVALGRGGDVRI